MFATLPDGEFDLIAADPPWRFTSYSDLGLERAPEAHYDTITLEDLCALPVRSVAAKDCHLMLWINTPSLAAGFHTKILRAWGFKPSSVAFVWVKTKKTPRKIGALQPITSEDFAMGLGKTTRQNAELVILGRRGRPKRYDNAIHQIIAEPRREHSRKPDEFYRRAERYAAPNARRLDLFARQPREGWTVWGNQTDKFAERT